MKSELSAEVELELELDEVVVVPELTEDTVVICVSLHPQIEAASRQPPGGGRNRA